MGTARTQANREDTESSHLKNDRDDIAGKWDLHSISHVILKFVFSAYLCWRYFSHCNYV